MSQQLILDYLEKQKKKIKDRNDRLKCVSQICKDLELPANVVSKNLRVLLRYKEIKCIEMDRFKTAKLTKSINVRRRTRFYYV